ncbi:alpha/beta hydrolase [Cellulophaga baltica]|uniref:alpha/beta hydrolase n=1 Tax=Cellulophaga TaxID=104264 RepID=UPI001C07C6DB|nr:MULTISPECIES: alpha/beta hydrolase [Cellulophaga]MBU2996705.1 alpha/beta hydrolase [Cellulophaga baltica]MDO6768099.1 alpha/beta hydrolase [Cellulophaga sp. 1_MG-2023]
MKKVILNILIISLYGLSVKAQDTIVSLWTNKIPNYTASDEKEIRKENDRRVSYSFVQNPLLEVYLPSKGSATGKAMLIFPGGGYHHLAYDWEGTDIAKFLNSKGIAGIVVKYRLPNSKSLTENYKVPLQDAQRAMRMVRANAENWNIIPDEVGVIGFSAGGHLASTLGTHFNEVAYEPQDEIDDLTARPDFMALIYPVISMQDNITHNGSKKALLGEKPTDELRNYYSNELQVQIDSPPTFLVHATDDNVVVVENSLLFYLALRENKIPVEMHVYPSGGHGFSLANSNAILKHWPEQLNRWIDNLNYKD